MAAATVPWFVQAFDGNWLRLYAHRSDAEALARVGDVVRLTGLRPGQRVLDVGCGAGRYARALAARGMRVTGVDLSEEMLDAARAASPNLPGAPQYSRHDARQLPFFQQFEAVISMFTSFGYFEDRKDDLRIFQGVQRALLAGGRFLLDYLNEAQVRATLVPEDTRDVGNLRVHSVRHIEEGTAGDFVCKRLVARDRGSDRLVTAFEERVRLYTSDDVDALLREAGLEPEGEPLGDVDGRALTPDAPRLVRVARRS